jgi:hypothetical protein
VHCWAPLARRHPHGLVLAVDTFLGDINMRLKPEFQSVMQLKNGMPQMYGIFLQRMVHEQIDDIVVPFTIHSVVAARIIAALEWTVDVVYVDSAHELGETYIEILMYWQLLRPGGVLIGDDYMSFPAVRHDVDKFCNTYGVEVELFEGEWMIRKPGGTPELTAKMMEGASA